MKFGRNVLNIKGFGVRPTEVSKDIVEKFQEEYDFHRGQALLANRTVHPKTNFNPSDAGWDCDAYHILYFNHWDQVPPFAPDTLEIFGEGRLHEPDIVNKLQSAGFTVSHQEVEFQIILAKSWKVISGRVDLMLEHKGQLVPAEAKTMSPYAWDKIHTWEDFLLSKHTYHKLYVDQLNTYMLACQVKYEEMHGEAPQDLYGVFILKNKVTGRVKFVPMPYQPERIEALLHRVGRVSRTLTKPDVDLQPFKNISEEWCPSCKMREICLGQQDQKMTPLLEDDDLEQVMIRREQLKPAKSEYEKLDKLVKDQVKEKPELIIGDFYVKGKWLSRKEYTVKASEYWRSSIIYKGAPFEKKKADIDDIESAT